MAMTMCRAKVLNVQMCYVMIVVDLRGADSEMRFATILETRFSSHKLCNFLAEHGIHHETPPQFSPQVNSITEWFLSEQRF
jgi:hypothetical protein